MIGASEEGSYVYFTAAGALAPGAAAGECGGNSPSLGEKSVCNLYVSHDGRTTLVAALSQEDFPDWSGGGEDLGKTTARVSPDGGWLAFMSQRSLTGYDTSDAVSGRPDEEVYLYDASANRLVCASCNPTGARPVGVAYEKINDELVGGDRVWDAATGIAANIPGWTPFSLGESRYQSRYLSDSGRLFFNSSDALVPQDVDGTEDVYEYEPPGAGSCTQSVEAFSERLDGCVGLISSGSSPEESAFLDASETGGDVFFLTKAKLVSEDFDTSLDVYDAHECTSQAPCFPVAAVAPPVCETGEACKPAPTPQPPIFGAPASGTFSGTGNVVVQSAVKVAVGSKSLDAGAEARAGVERVQEEQASQAASGVRTQSQEQVRHEEVREGQCEEEREVIVVGLIKRGILGMVAVGLLVVGIGWGSRVRRLAVVASDLRCQADGSSARESQERGAGNHGQRDRGRRVRGRTGEPRRSAARKDRTRGIEGHGVCIQRDARRSAGWPWKDSTGRGMWR